MGSEAIEEAAARWLAKRNGSVWTDVDQSRLDAWCAESLAHRIAYVRLEAAWNRAARLRALGAHVAAGVIPPRGSWGDQYYSLGSARGGHATAGDARAPTAATRARAGAGWRAALRLPARWYAFAAGCLLLLGGGVYDLVVPPAVAEVSYSTPVGGMNQIKLDDGSEVTLNTDTSIRVAFTPGYRGVQLDHGEAFFEVAKDKSRPFVVYAGSKSVMAVGTKFAVRRDDSDVQVVVTEGRVNFTGAVAAAPVSPPTYLSAGDVARASKSEVLVRTNAESDAERLLSWRSGYVVFDDTALVDAVAEFNRYNTRKISIEDPAIASIRIGGNFRATNIDGFLWLLQNGFPIAVELRGDKVILKPR